jgi:hypothetical protein
MDDREEAAWTNSRRIAATDQTLQDERLTTKDERLKFMAKLGYRERTLLPEGRFFRFRILSAEIDEEGKFGAQLPLEVKVLGGGEYGGHVFTDWSKLATDEDTGEVFVVEDGKAEEIFLAVGADPTKADTDDLVGKVLMARVSVSENRKRNRLEYGSIGPVLEDEENHRTEPRQAHKNHRTELRQAHKKMRQVTDVPSDGGYVEGEDEPDPTE